MEIVRCIMDGYKERQIGVKLEISPNTVHAHMTRLFRKTRSHSRSDLMVRVMLA